MPDEPMENQSDRTSPDATATDSAPQSALDSDEESGGGPLKPEDIEALQQQLQQDQKAVLSSETADPAGVATDGTDGGLDSGLRRNDGESAGMPEKVPSLRRMPESREPRRGLDSGVRRNDGGKGAELQADFDQAQNPPDAEAVSASDGTPEDDLSALDPGLRRGDGKSRAAEVAGLNARPMDLPDFSSDSDAANRRDISVLRDVDLKVHIELGQTQMYIEDVLKLHEGSVVELDNLAGDPVDVFVNGRLVARGEVLVLSDNFCVRVSEIVSGPQPVSVV